MAITYPLDMPDIGYRTQALIPESVVGVVTSPWTGHQQVQPQPGEWLRFAISLPPLNEVDANEMACFFMSLRGPTGTFKLKPQDRTVPLSNFVGPFLLKTGAGCTANSSNLPVVITGASLSAVFSVGDWIRVDSGANARMHKILKVNASSFDVFPVLRTAYASDVIINSNDVYGIFCLQEHVPVEFDEERICNGMRFEAVEAIR